MSDPWVRKEVIGDCTLYQGDCLEVMPTLGAVDAVVTDPPYGNKHCGDSTRFSGGNVRRGNKSNHGPIIGNGEPFDPTPFLVGSAQIFWGANYFPDRLQAGSLLVWSKRRPAAYGTFLSDGEVAWFSRGTGVYLFQHIFAGSSVALERGADPYAPSAHPFQKPVAVMEWCLEKVPDASIVCDPFMGSGTTGVACAKMGRKFIGIELDPDYFDIACERIRETYRQPDMFIEAEKPKPAEQIDMLTEEGRA